MRYRSGQAITLSGDSRGAAGNDDTSSVASALLPIEMAVSMSAVAVRTPPLLDPPTRLELHPDERFEGSEMEETESGWKFCVTDPAFDARFGIEIFGVPESGDPAPLDRA